MNPSSALATVRSLYDAFGRGDLPAFLALLHPEASWRFNGGKAAAYTREVRGPAGVGEWLGQVMETDDIQVFEPREFIAADTHVTVLGWERTRDRRSGRSFECDWVHVIWVDQGRVTRFWGLLDTEAAAATR